MRLGVLLLSGTLCAQSGPDVELLDPPAAEGALAFDLSARGDDVVLSWLEKTDAGHALRFSRLVDGKWTPERAVVEGADFFANWADFPSVILGEGGEMAAHWLARLGEGTYAYGVQLARSSDDGASWRRVGALHDDDSATEHGFVSIVPTAGGFDAIWLDGRAMADGGSMSLRAAELADAPAEGVVLDADVCTCCQTDAVHTAGGLIAVYRDHADEEVRDISFVRRTSDGWSEPRAVHDDGWRIAGCPVNGPSIDAHADRVAVGWFTAADDRPRVLLAMWDDETGAFGWPTVIDDAEPVGRVAVACLDDGAVVAWLARGEGGARVVLRLVTYGGQLGDVVELSTTGASRSSGFPRMVRTRGDLVVAWRDTAAAPRLRTARVAGVALRSGL